MSKQPDKIPLGVCDCRDCDSRASGIHGAGCAGKQVVTMTLREWCKEKDACGPALEWLEDRDLPTAWRECPQGDWMLWLAARLCCYGDDLHRAVVLAAVECAETARQFAPPKHLPLIDRCYETARAWALGPTPENVAAALAADAAYAALAADAAYAAYAAYAADAAYAAAYAAYAAYAAEAAADAAYAAADAADAAEAAYAVHAAEAAALAAYAADAAVVALAAEAAALAAYAADAAEAAADAKAAHLRCAEIVRKHVPLDLVLEALEREAA